MDTLQINDSLIEERITERTKAIIQTKNAFYQKGLFHTPLWRTWSSAIIYSEPYRTQPKIRHFIQRTSHIRHRLHQQNVDHKPIQNNMAQYNLYNP